MFFQQLVQGEFMGLDENTKSAPPAAAVARHPRDTQTYYYQTGVYGECSAACNGGMRSRSVECRELNSVNPRVVDETKCIAQRLLRPQSQEACNMHRCVHAQYSVSSFGAVSDGGGHGSESESVSVEVQPGCHKYCISNRAKEVTFAQNYTNVFIDFFILTILALFVTIEMKTSHKYFFECPQKVLCRSKLTRPLKSRYSPLIQFDRN